jgi:hypothetical protein
MIAAAYDLSSAVGLGWLHYTPEPLGPEDVDNITSVFAGDKRVAVSMDYVKGRCCKFTVFRHPTDDSVLLIEPRWFDHTARDLSVLLEKAGLEDVDSLIASAENARDTTDVTQGDRS